MPSNKLPRIQGRYFPKDLTVCLPLVLPRSQIGTTLWRSSAQFLLDGSVNGVLVLESPFIPFIQLAFLATLPLFGSIRLAQKLQ